MPQRFITTPARLAALAVAVAGVSLALPQASAQAAVATTYYVSANGSDSADGRSPATAIRSLGRASGLGLNPGDRVLLERNTTFSGKLAVWRSGTATAPITIASYGSGALPVVTGECLEVGGSYITMSDFVVSGCYGNGIWTNGTGNLITGIEATHNIHGIDVGPQSQGTRVLRNWLHNNDRMAPNTPGAFDDYGAVGVVVEGDNTEVAGNTIADNWAPSADFGTDGSAVEIYGGIGTLVRHNVANNNRTFTELGNRRSANTIFAYNQVTSSLTDTEFLITRGDRDYFGPVANTVAVNNTVQLTGANSLGFSCYAGCTANYFTLYNNVLDVAGRIGYVEGSMAGGNNVYWRGRMDGLRLMTGDRYVDPGFAPGSLVPSTRSPLVDSAENTSIKEDIDGDKVGVDGNGDGKRGTDIGAHEKSKKHQRGKGWKSRHGAKGKHAKGKHAQATGKHDRSADRGTRHAAQGDGKGTSRRGQRQERAHSRH